MADTAKPAAKPVAKKPAAKCKPAAKPVAAAKAPPAPTYTGCPEHPDYADWCADCQRLNPTEPSE